MISLETCREILGEEAPDDNRDLEAQREDAYRIARLLLEVFFAQKTSAKASTPLAEDAEL